MEKENKKLKDIGNRIKEARKKKGISQAELADSIGVSLTYMSCLENGKKTMSIDKLIKITDVLQISADWLLRSDIPEVRSIYIKEIEEILKDKSNSEIEKILKALLEIV